MPKEKIKERRSGIYKDQKKITAPELGEVTAARGEDVFSDWLIGTNQVNPNDFYNKESTRTLVSQWETMERSDPHLFGLLQTRMFAILGLKREIIGEGVIADFVRETFANIKQFDWKLYEILTAIPIGFSVTEIWWEYDGTYQYIYDLLGRSQDKFAFDEDWWLLLKTSKNIEGERVEEGKFGVFTFMGKYGNRYGSALLQKVYWYWYFKKHSTKFWSIFTERFASPIVIATEPEGSASPESRATVEGFIEDLKSQTGLTVPPGWVIELLEAKESGAITNFQSFLDYLDDGMAKAILGQPLTSGTGTGGTQTNALGNIHELVRQDILQADISFLESFINDVIIKWLVDINFSDVKEYPKWKIIPNKTVDKKIMSEVLKIVVAELGHEWIPVWWVNETFGFPEVEDGKDIKFLKAPVQKSTNEFSVINDNNLKTYLQDLKELK